MRIGLASLVGSLLVVVSPACHVVGVDSAGSPPRIESRGIVDGHLAVGIPREDHLFHLDLFDGTSDGAIGELVVWKLLRIEVGLAGVSLGLGPLHAGMGVLLYEPEVPELEKWHASESGEADGASGGGSTDAAGESPVRS